jgi:hypothetical protein
MNRALTFSDGSSLYTVIRVFAWLGMTRRWVKENTCRHCAKEIRRSELS